MDYDESTKVSCQYDQQGADGKDIQGDVEGDTVEGIVTIVEMNLGDPEECTGVLRLLAVVLSNKLSVKEKKRILEEEFEIKFTKKEKENVKDMCDLGEAIEREAYHKERAETLIKLLTQKLKVLSEELILVIQSSSLEKLAELLDDFINIECENDVFMILNT